MHHIYNRNTRISSAIALLLFVSAGLSITNAEVPQLELPPITEVANDFNATFPFTVEGEPETCGNARKHLKELEDWRAGKLEPMREKLESFDTKVGRFDMDVERRLGQHLIETGDYSAWKATFATYVQLTASDGPWLKMYKLWRGTLRKEVLYWQAIIRRSGC
jgi:hypothetical protein